MTHERILKIKEIFEQHYSIVKTCVLRENKVCSRDITELISDGYIIKVKTGYYAWKSNITELQDIELVQSIIPTGIISMSSAAQIHKLIGSYTTATCVTIPTKMIKPILPVSPEIELFYCLDNNYKLGMMNYKMPHIDIKIYNPERTVCDLFKYIDRIENEVALESLKSYMLKKDKDVKCLLEYAGLLRVQKYIKPIVEVLI